MKKIKELTILDLSKDYNFLIKDSDIYQLSFGITKIQNSKLLNVNFFTDRSYSEFTNKLNQQLIHLYNYLNKNNSNIDLNLLEIFNQRNDKTNFFNKLYFFLQIKKKIFKKYKSIKIISDDQNFIEIYNSINTKNIKVVDLSAKPLKFYNLFYFKSILLFFTKTFLFLVFINLFYSKKKINSQKTSECCLSIFPIFFKKNNNSFYKKKLLNLNFQITDETHLGNSLIKNIKLFDKVNNIKNTISVEKYITFSSFLLSILISIKNFVFVNKIQKYNFIFENLNISNVIHELFIYSLININKLTIYNSAIKRILKDLSAKKFHYFMFEYNFGYYLTSLIKKNFSNIKLIGYQHGIYSERLMWQNFIKTKKNSFYSPNEIFANFKQSFVVYKKNFYKSKIKLFNRSTKYFGKKNSVSNHNIVFLGLHDCYFMLNYLRNLKIKQKFNLKLHPKQIYKNLIDLKDNLSLLKTNFYIKKKYNNFVSTTSTMPYNFYKNKQKFKILLPSNCAPLNPKKFDKYIFKS